MAKDYLKTVRDAMLVLTVTRDPKEMAELGTKYPYLVTATAEEILLAISNVTPRILNRRLRILAEAKSRGMELTGSKLEKLARASGSEADNTPETLVEPEEAPDEEEEEVTPEPEPKKKDSKKSDSTPAPEPEEEEEPEEIDVDGDEDEGEITAPATDNDDGMFDDFDEPEESEDEGDDEGEEESEEPVSEDEDEDAADIDGDEDGDDASEATEEDDDDDDADLDALFGNDDDD